MKINILSAKNRRHLACTGGPEVHHREQSMDLYSGVLQRKAGWKEER